ncbi:MAG: cytochrome B [Rhodospirillales bacterium]|jgi:cytochrome b|nr:cytochrome B [Rhodospirillales bacterium]
MSDKNTVPVWDRFVRIFHWVLLAAFIAAMATEGEPLFVHVRAGYVIGILIVARLIWGFAGPQYARFSNFIYSPRTVLTYLRDVLRGRAPRYVGHNPAGGAMIVVMLFCLSATVFTGLATLAVEENAGPLAPVFGTVTAVPSSGFLVSTALADDDDRRRGHKDGDEDSVFEEAHDFFAHFTLFLAFFHFAGVLVSSFAHRENLIWSMVTGRKRPESEIG